MITKLENKAYWIHIPKNGTQSIMKSVYSVFGPNNEHKDFLFSLSEEEFNKFDLGFAFVRNPINRVISSWRHTSTKNFGHRFIGHNKSFIEYINFLNSFDFNNQDFLETQNLSVQDKLILHHSIPSFNHIERDGKIPENLFIGRMENLHEDWKKIQEVIKKSTGKHLPNLPHANPCKNPGMFPDGIKTPDILNKIYQIYKLDYENFGYEKSN